MFNYLQNLQNKFLIALRIEFAYDDEPFVFVMLCTELMLTFMSS